MQWNQKERDLLKDLKDQEQLCVDKYMRHAENACDPQLKNLFSQLAQQEAQHLKTVTEMESGTIPQMNGGSQNKPTFTAAYTAENQAHKHKNYRCNIIAYTNITRIFGVIHYLDFLTLIH